MGMHPGLLIAGGVGALGIGYLLMKDDKPKGGADPASKDPGAGAAAPTTPTGTTTPPPTAGSNAAAASSAGIGAPGARTGPAGQLPGEQVGPYTIVADPASGAQVVIETATQQPVGILDQQGNVVPITIDAAGNVSTVSDPGPAGPSPAGRAGGAAPTYPGAAGIGAPAGQAVTGASRYSLLAEALFAGVGDPSVGSASSGAMSGATSLAPSTQRAQPSVAGTATSSPAGQQVGPYTVLPDPASGMQLVVETFTGQPVGILDRQGNLIPVAMDQAGNLVPGGPPAAGRGMPVGPAPTTPAAASRPTVSGGALASGF